MTEQEVTDNDLGNLIRFHEPASAKNLAERAEKELSETPKLKEESLKQLKKLIEENNVACVTSDDFLLRFLRTRKFDIERSFQSLRNYVRHRVEFHELFTNFNPELMKKLVNLQIMGFLPYRDKDERLIFYCRTGIWNSDICSEKDMLAFTFLVCNYALQDPSLQISGIVTIFDTKNFSIRNEMGLLRNVNYLKNYFSNCAPVRYRIMHVINVAPVFQYVFRFLKLLIPKKLQERILFHGETREIIFQYFVPSILPTEFGGNLGQLNNDCLLKELEEYLENIKDEQRHFLETKT